MGFNSAFKGLMSVSYLPFTKPNSIKICVYILELNC